MRIHITTDDGELLDSLNVTREEWDREQSLFPHSLLGQVQVGDAR